MLGVVVLGLMLGCGVRLDVVGELEGLIVGCRIREIIHQVSNSRKGKQQEVYSAVSLFFT